jgi:hypothetical protein
VIVPRAKQQMLDHALWWSEHRSSEQAFDWLIGFENKLRASNKMELQEIGADEDAAECEKGLMDIVTSFTSYAKPAKLMEPANRPFDDPTVDAQATSMLSVAFCQDRFDSSVSQLLAMAGGVVRAIPLDSIRTLSWATAFSTNWRDRVHQRQQLGDVVRIRASQRGREGNAVGVRGQMMLAAGFTAICWIGSRFFPPCMARTEEESTITRDQSSRSASRKRAKRTSWISFQIPFRCQACRRRQAVIPDPQPSSCGKYSQGRPVLSTNKIAHRTLRLSIGLRPGCRLRRFFGAGSSGSIIAHKSSSKIGFAMTHLLVLP